MIILCCRLISYSLSMEMNTGVLPIGSIMIKRAKAIVKMDINTYKVGGYEWISVKGVYASFSYF